MQLSSIERPEMMYWTFVQPKVGKKWGKEWHLIGPFLRDESLWDKMIAKLEELGMRENSRIRHFPTHSYRIKDLKKHFENVIDHRDNQEDALEKSARGKPCITYSRKKQSKMHITCGNKLTLCNLPVFMSFKYNSKRVKELVPCKNCEIIVKNKLIELEKK